MPVSLKHNPQDKTLKVTIQGKLDAEDYSRFTPLVADLVKQHGKLDLLVVLQDFQGWTAGALWKDIKFEVHHYDDISKLAIVGDRRWEEEMAKFCEPFTTAEVRFFPHEELAEAQDWVGATEPVVTR